MAVGPDSTSNLGRLLHSVYSRACPTSGWRSDVPVLHLPRIDRAIKRVSDPPSWMNPDEEKAHIPLVSQESLANSPEALATGNSSSRTSSVAEDDTHEHHLYPSPEGDVNKRARKRQKQQILVDAAQINKLQTDIAEMKQRLASPIASSMQQAHTVAQSCMEMQKQVEFLRCKLAEHSYWMQHVSSLIEWAPLFDFAVGMDTKQRQQQDQTSQDQEERDEQQHAQQGCSSDSKLPLDRSLLSLQSLDEWRKAPEIKPLSRFILDERLRTAVGSLHQNGSKLLEDLAVSNLGFKLPLRFESRGWKIAAGTLDSRYLAFSCQRRLPAATINNAKEVALEVWSSVQRDEVLRTFVPLVVDSVIAYEGTDCSLSRRTLQLGPNSSQQTVATVESISAFHGDEGNENTWQISVEAVHDHYLCSFVANDSGDLTVPKSSAPIKLDFGTHMSKLNMHNKFAVAVRIMEADQGVEVVLVGSTRFELQQLGDPAFDLLQYFVSLLPVYEDLHLAQYATG